MAIGESGALISGQRYRRGSVTPGNDQRPLLCDDTLRPCRTPARSGDVELLSVLFLLAVFLETLDGIEQKEANSAGSVATIEECDEEIDNEKGK
jgi:hypothetical protein